MAKVKERIAMLELSSPHFTADLKQKKPNINIKSFDADNVFQNQREVNVQTISIKMLAAGRCWSHDFFPFSRTFRNHFCSEMIAFNF